MDDKDEIRSLVVRLLAANGDFGLINDDESLIVSGRLQSIDAVEIVVFLEEHFRVDFIQIGFDRERIDTINAIHKLTLSDSSKACVD